MANEQFVSRYRKYGEEQPYWKAGIFKIRLPFVHYKWSVPEMVQAVFMCATCLGAIPVLQEVLGVSYGVALSMVIINGFFYNLHVLLGDPVVPGWITPAIPIITAFLTDGYEMGPERTQALIAMQLILGLIFLVFGITGIGGKMVHLVPNSVKAGVLMGGGLAAIIGEMGETGRFWTYPISITVGVLVAYFCLFSPIWANLRRKYKAIDLIGKFGMLPAIIIGVVLGPIVKEIAVPAVQLWPLIKIPEFGNIWNQLSPFAIGWPSAATWIAAIPTAIVVYISLPLATSSPRRSCSAPPMRSARMRRLTSTPTAPTSSAVSGTWPWRCAAPTPRPAVPCGRPLLPLCPSGTRRAPRPWSPSTPVPVPSAGVPLSAWP